MENVIDKIKVQLCDYLKYLKRRYEMWEGQITYRRNGLTEEMRWIEEEIRWWEAKGTERDLAYV